MSIEPKYNITNNQLEYILRINKTISIVSSIFSICVSFFIVNTATSLVVKNQLSQIMIILSGIGSLIFGIRLYSAYKEKQELMQKIKNTAHYESTQK